MLVKRIKGNCWVTPRVTVRVTASVRKMKDLQAVTVVTPKIKPMGKNIIKASLENFNLSSPTHPFQVLPCYRLRKPLKTKAETVTLERSGNTRLLSYRAVRLT